jgi:hypothetical protein
VVAAVRPARRALARTALASRELPKARARLPLVRHAARTSTPAAEAALASALSAARARTTARFASALCAMSEAAPRISRAARRVAAPPRRAAPRYPPGFDLRCMAVLRFIATQLLAHG